MSFSVYVLQSETTGEIYIGQTHDLATRLAQHNDPEHDFTLHTKRRRAPWWTGRTTAFPGTCQREWRGWPHPQAWLRTNLP